MLGTLGSARTKIRFFPPSGLARAPHGTARHTHSVTRHPWGTPTVDLPLYSHGYTHARPGVLDMKRSTHVLISGHMRAASHADQTLKVSEKPRLQPRSGIRVEGAPAGFGVCLL